MPPSILESSLVLIGLGRAGRAFARSWTAAGGAAPRLVARTREAAEVAARSLPAGTPAGLDDLEPSSRCDILVLAVPDDQIRPVSSAVAPRLACATAFHLSGALPAEALAPLARRGASIGSLHPLRAFAGEESETWKGAFVAIEAGGAAGEVAERLTDALGAHGHPLSGAAKPLYHAGATLSAGGVVALLSMAVRAWTRAGLPQPEARRALVELAIDALEHAGALDFDSGLTGPISRRDVDTVRSHLRALAGEPEVLRVYWELARETLRRTPGRGREEEIERLLSETASEPET